LVKTYTKNDVLTVGTYVAYFKITMFADEIAWLMEQLSGLLETAFEVAQGKPIRIFKIETKTEGSITYILLHFELLNNPVPVALIVGAIIAVLGLVGTFMVFDKIEGIVDSPAGSGIGAILLVTAVIAGFTFFKDNLKT